MSSVVKLETLGGIKKVWYVPQTLSEKQALYTSQEEDEVTKMPFTDGFRVQLIISGVGGESGEAGGDGAAGHGQGGESCT